MLNEERDNDYVINCCQETASSKAGTCSKLIVLTHPLLTEQLDFVLTYPSKQHQKGERVNKQSVQTLTIKRNEKPNNQFSPSYANKKHHKALETKEAKCPKPTTSKMALKIPSINII